MNAAQFRVIQQLRHHVPLSRAGGVRQLEVDQQTVTVLHQRVTHVRQLRFEPATFLPQTCFGVRCAPVCGVQAFLASEVHRRIAGIIGRGIRRRLVFRAEALQQPTTVLTERGPITTRAPVGAEPLGCSRGSTRDKAYEAAVATARKLLARVYVVLKEHRPYDVR